ncbi:MAG TPA: CDP-alcohol phosphatidyltransferase family protein [Candidatus Binataceae bacterium]|nr:CDP-alcohol phosphatidyltransferase family protein [Candidatus Binataceae bacterium]
MNPASLKSAKQVHHPQGLVLWHLLNIPNLLTLGRLFLVPIFLALLSQHRFGSALYIFCIAGLTDALDGTIARWFDLRTEIGALLDPFADKLLLLSAFVGLTVEDVIPGWLLGVVITRDIVIVFGYLLLIFYTDERVPVRPSYLGKAATCFQLASVVGALAGLGQSWADGWHGLLYATVAITALSGIHYAYQGLVWLSSREPEMFE